MPKDREFRASEVADLVFPKLVKSDQREGAIKRVNFIAYNVAGLYVRFINRKY